MVLPTALLVIRTRLLLTWLQRSQHASDAEPDHARTAHPAPPIGVRTAAGRQAAPVWSPVDDRQLTGLLTNFAPHTTTE